MFESNGSPKAPQHPYRYSISQFMQNAEFFYFLANALFLHICSCYRSLLLAQWIPVPTDITTKYFIAVTTEYLWKLHWAHFMNIFILKISAFWIKIFCNKEWKLFQSNCMIFCDNHSMIVLTTPMYTIPKGQKSVMKRKHYNTQSYFRVYL